MITCQTCHSELHDSSRFCSACGTPASSPSPETATLLIEPVLDATTPMRNPTRSAGVASTAVATRLHLTGLPKAGRFQPGDILVGRYQLIGLLGKGGMGEVYRANDLTLDQTVALKFLPEGMARNPAMLARFHGEVRIARQVSHPNVCRVYDIGEVDGQLFLSMEYVDGEDLRGLLRRIGRLPGDKAVEFARKICAGLAAAHDKGVLHRDLKPANIMINGEGNVVIMDFGLAAVADQVQGMEIRAGTPAYMSPEQLIGREVTVRSDIYGLGLVLFEMFTGKRPFECESLAELMHLQTESHTLSVSSVVKDIDPAVEGIIARCLSPDPKNRPPTPLAVAAALPGGDPLAAALAAGETPSPELVAASGKVAGIRPMWAVLCAIGILIGLAAVTILGQSIRLTSVVPLELPPDAMTLKAREYARSFGYSQKPVDSARGFQYDSDYLRYLLVRDKSPNRFAQLANPQPGSILFWYRQSPRYLETLGFNRGQVTYNDPPPIISGMLSERLDPRGRLLSFHAIPPQVDDTVAPSGPMDWTPLFVAAGLDKSKFKEVPPTWVSLSMSDVRAAWTGTWPEAPEKPLRIEAGAWKGRPVAFEMIGDWTRANRMTQQELTRPEKMMQFILLSIAVSGLLGAALLARYNLKHGRGDRRGAFKLAGFGFVLQVSLWVMLAHHVPTSNEVGQLFMALANALFIGAVLWVGYLALEPYVRRYWPQAIVTWSRVMAGGLRDPLVGRDILIGVAFGVFWALNWSVSTWAELSKGGPSNTVILGAMEGARQTVATALVIVPSVLIQLFVSFFILFLLRVLLRKEWLAVAGYVTFVVLFTAASSSSPAIDIPFGAALAITYYLAVARFGFVTFLVGTYVTTLFVLFPVSSDFSTWFSGASLFVILLTVGLAAYGMHAALAGRSILEDTLFLGNQS